MLVLRANIFPEMLPFMCNIVYMLHLSIACLISSLMKYCITKWNFIICFYAFVQLQTRAGHCAQPELDTIFFCAAFEQSPFNTFSFLFFNAVYQEFSNKGIKCCPFSFPCCLLSLLYQMRSTASQSSRLPGILSFIGLYSRISLSLQHQWGVDTFRIHRVFLLQMKKTQ